MALPTRDDRKAWRLAVFCLLWTMYGVSLFLPVTEGTDTTSATSGLAALTMGWSGMGILVEFANVAFVFGTIGFLVRQTEMALICGVAATALSSLAPNVFGIHFADLRVAYFLWVATMVTLALAAAFELFSERRTPEKT